MARSFKIYGTGSATANAVANIAIPFATRIIGVGVDWVVDSITDGAVVTMELSLASAAEIAINAAQQCIYEGRLYHNFVTSGMSSPNVNGFFFADIAMKQGQQVYLHAAVSGTASYIFTGLIWVRD